METTRRGQPLGPGRIDRTKVKATTEDDMRRHMAEYGLDPDNPLAGYRPLVSPSEVRKHSDLSQDARALGVPVKTIRDWEQGRSMPDPASQALLKIVDPGVDGFDIEPFKGVLARAAEEDAAGARREQWAERVNRALLDVAARVEIGVVTKEDAAKLWDQLNDLRGLQPQEIDLLLDVWSKASAA